MYPIFQSKSAVTTVFGLALVCLVAVSPAAAVCQASGKYCGINTVTNDRLCCPGMVCGWGNICQPGCRINGAFYRRGANNPANACQTCQPSVSTTRWSSSPSTTRCRDVAGECDAPEYCTGTSAVCPPDAKRTTVCRPSTGVCDLAESCNGVHDSCPADIEGTDDVTQPGDPIVASSNNSPGSEGVANAIDNQPTKYLNFDELNTGFTVTPSLGPTLVGCLTLTSANDAPERDPASYTLEGSNDGGATFTPISAGAIPNFLARHFKIAIPFSNSATYQKYRLIFPTVRDAASANSMQISEVELLCVCPD